MTGSAIALMVVAMLVIWGGLVLAVVNLRRSTDLPREEEIRRDL